MGPSGSPEQSGNREGRQGAPPWLARVQKLGRHTAQAGLYYVSGSKSRAAPP